MLEEYGYENLYEEDGYSLTTSASVYVPWFRCTLQCKCRKERPMSTLDGIVCKCISRDICSVKDIAFVLSLDSGIVRGEIMELIGAGLIAEQEEVLSLTEGGIKACEKKSRTEETTEEYTVYWNAVTGEWCIVAENFLTGEKVPDPAIRLAPIRVAARTDIEDNEEIRKCLQEVKGVYITAARLSDKAVLYRQEFILFYVCGTGDVRLAFLKEDRGQLDTALAMALGEKYKRREVLELVQAERHLDTARQSFVRENSFLSQNGGQEFRYLQNKEIRELFKKVLAEAQESIFIVSPWINDFGFTDELVDVLEEAIAERGVYVDIGYGIWSQEEMEEKRRQYAEGRNRASIERDRNWRTLQMAESLERRFAKYERFRIFYIGTHEKILSYDNKYTFIGSYNLLSYDGGEQNDYNGFGFRYEGGALIESSAFAADVKARVMGRKASAAGDTA